MTDNIASTHYNNGLQCQVLAGERSTNGTSSKSHRQAEKRRRDRINAQLAKLRKFIPNSDKMDKATLLDRVVEQVKELKRNASEINQFLTIPSEIDDVTIECDTNIQQRHSNTHNIIDNNDILIKITICCEDRPDIIPEIIRTLKSMSLIVIEAEITCLGGRMKSILVVCSKYYDEVGSKHGVYNANFVKQSLMTILNRVISWSTSTPNFRVTSKRQRFFYSS